MIIIQKKNLLAASLITPEKKDNRYTRGVCLEVTSSKVCYLISTTGDCLFVGEIEGDFTSDVNEPVKLIIPIDVIKLAVKSSEYDAVKLSRIDETTWQLGNITFEPISAMFPDWLHLLTCYCRIVNGALKNSSEQVAQFSPSLLNTVNKALTTFKGEKLAKTYLHHAGDAAALMTIKRSIDDVEAAYCVVMPWRVEHQEKPSKPVDFIA